MTFNAVARREFEKIFTSTQTVDIGIKKNGDGKLQVVFVPHKDMCGQYRIQRGGQTKDQTRVCISLDTKGYKVGRGPWPVREVDGMILAEVGE